MSHDTVGALRRRGRWCRRRVQGTRRGRRGLWAGLTNISVQGDFQLIAIVAENGRAYVLQEDEVMYWGTVTSSGNQITSTLEGAGVYGLPLRDGSNGGTGSASGTIQARSSIAANAIVTTAFAGRTTSSISLTFDPLYNDDSSLALIAGNYVDAIGRYPGVLNIASNGDLFLQDPGTGCVVNGRVSIINASYNAYDVQFSCSGCTGSDAVLNGATFRGLAAYNRQFQEVVVLPEGTVGGAQYPNVFVFDPAQEARCHPFTARNHGLDDPASLVTPALAPRDRDAPPGSSTGVGLRHG